LTFFAYIMIYKEISLYYTIHIMARAKKPAINIENNHTSDEEDNNTDQDNNNDPKEEIIVHKKRHGERGRDKKYQHLTEEEYQAIKKQQQRDAYNRYRLKNKDLMAQKSKQYYEKNKQNIIKKQIEYQKNNYDAIKIKRLEKSLSAENYKKKLEQKLEKITQLMNEGPPQARKTKICDKIKKLKEK
jgi:hypothetical protein